MSFSLNQRDLGFIAMLLIAGTLVYANSLHSPFHFDDSSFIVNNAAVRAPFDLHGLFLAFSSRWITGLSLAANYRLSGLHVFAYNLTNLLLHLGNAVLAYLLARGICQRVPLLLRRPMSLGEQQLVSLGTALVFMLHPVQTQAVNYLSQRSVLLAAFFALLSLNLYLTGRRLADWRWIFWAWLAAMTGTLTKESSFILPFLLMVIESCCFWEPREGWLRVLRRVGPFLLSWVLLAGVLLSQGLYPATGLGAGSPESYFGLPRFLAGLNVFRTYLRLLILPVGLNLDYDYPLPMGLWSDGSWLSLALLAGLLVTVYVSRRTARILTLGILWFYVSVLTEFIPSAVLGWGPDVMYEHWLYLAVFGFALVLVWGIFALGLRPATRGALAVVLIVGLSGLTWSRNRVWQDPLALWSDVVKKSPRKARGYNNLAAVYIARGDLAAAAGTLQQSLDLEPGQEEAHINYGLLLMKTGEEQAAVQHFVRALERNPHSARAHNNLGVLFMRQSALTLAEEAFQQAVQSEQGFYLEPHLNLVLLARRQQRHRVALQRLLQLAETYPYESRIRYELALQLFAAGNKAQARKMIQPVLKWEADPERLADFGSLCAEQGLRQLAVRFYQSGFKRRPQPVNLYVEYGKFLGNEERFSEAIAVWEEGQRRHPQEPQFSALIHTARALSKK